MAKFKDHTGETIGRLTFMEYLGADRNKKSLWRCKCSCGKVKIIVSASVLSGRVVSCGCYMVERIIETKVTHGFSNRKSGTNNLYGVWKAMKQRCGNFKNRDFKYYGAKGISVCESWHEFENFNDWALKNGYSNGLTIERNNPSLNYCPENCTWAPMYEQCRNKGNNVNITFKGQTKCLSDWARRYKISPSYLRQRLKKMTFEKAISLPIIRMRNYKFKSKTIQLSIPGIF